MTNPNDWTCRSCGKSYRRDASNDRRCSSCRHQERKHPCLDCGTPCDWRGLRCNLCAIKRTALSKRGNRTLHKPSGYVLVKMPDHPNARADGYIREHVLVMSEKLDRPLGPREIVHHKNGNRADNRPSNLELLQCDVHSADHAAVRNPNLLTFDIARAVAEYQDGAAMQEIADAQGVSLKAVRARLVRADVTIRPTGWRGRGRRVR